MDKAEQMYRLLHGSADAQWAHERIKDLENELETASEQLTIAYMAGAESKYDEIRALKSKIEKMEKIIDGN